MTVFLLVGMCAAGLALLGRTVWIPLSRRPAALLRSGVGRDVLLGLAVLKEISNAYAALVRRFLD